LIFFKVAAWAFSVSTCLASSSNLAYVCELVLAGGGDILTEAAATRGRLIMHWRTPDFSKAAILSETLCRNADCIWALFDCAILGWPLSLATLIPSLHAI
jgi:hypothetical protein